MKHLQDPDNNEPLELSVWAVSWLLAVTSTVQLMGTKIAVALWHNVVELTVCISQLMDHNKTSTAPSHAHHSLNLHPSVTVLMYEVDSEINFTTHGRPGHEMSVLWGQTERI